MERLKHVIPIFICVVGIAIFHRYSLLSGLDLVQADPNDSRFVLSILEHWFAVSKGRAAWDSPLMFYPQQGTLGYSDFSFGNVFLYVPARYFGVQPFTALNLVVIASSVLTFLFTYKLARIGLKTSPWIGSFIAYLFTFSWPRFCQSVHVQLQCSFFVPLTALLVLRIALAHKCGRPFSLLGNCCTLAAVFALFISTSYYLAFFTGLIIAGIVACAFISPALRSDSASLIFSRASSKCAGLILFFILLVPMLTVYLPAQKRSGGRIFAEALPYIPYPRDLLWMGGENLIWGHLADLYPHIAAPNWAELRIGFGAAWSATWTLAVLSVLVSLILPATRTRLLKLISRHTGIESAALGWLSVGVVVVVSMQLLALRYSSTISPWQIFFDWIPGASAARAVSRYVLVSSLVMAFVFGVVVQFIWNLSGTFGRRAATARAVILLLVFLSASEQIGRSVRYSGGAAIAQAHAIAEAIPPDCRAFFIEPKTKKFERSDISREQFNEARYLSANPDVAAIWPSGAWEHFVQYGRRELRFVDPEVAQDHRRHIEQYTYAVPLVASLICKPSVNGISGLVPQGWELMDIYHPQLAERLHYWLKERIAEVCVIQLDLDSLMLQTVGP